MVNTITTKQNVYEDIGVIMLNGASKSHCKCKCEPSGLEPIVPSSYTQAVPMV